MMFIVCIFVVQKGKEKHHARFILIKLSYRIYDRHRKSRIVTFRNRTKEKENGILISEQNKYEKAIFNDDNNLILIKYMLIESCKKRSSRKELYHVRYELHTSRINIIDQSFFPCCHRLFFFMIITINICVQQICSVSMTSKE